VDYQLIMPIRLMTAMDKDPVLRTRLNLLMEHREERQAEEDNWAKTHCQVVQPIRTRLKCTGWSEDLIQRCVGLIRTNATQSLVSISNNTGEGELATVRVLYPTMSIMSHSCIPNTRTIHRSDYILEARSMRQVKKGEELTISYTGW
jgi:SET domain